MFGFFVSFWLVKYPDSQNKSQRGKSLLFPKIQISQRTMDFPNLMKQKDFNLPNGELKINRASFIGKQFILGKIKCHEWVIVRLVKLKLALT